MQFFVPKPVTNAYIVVLQLSADVLREMILLILIQAAVHCRLHMYDVYTIVVRSYCKSRGVYDRNIHTIVRFVHYNCNTCIYDRTVTRIEYDRTSYDRTVINNTIVPVPRYVGPKGVRRTGIYVYIIHL